MWLNWEDSKILKITTLRGEAHCHGCDQTASPIHLILMIYDTGRSLVRWCDDCFETCHAYNRIEAEPI